MTAAITTETARTSPYRRWSSPEDVLVEAMVRPELHRRMWAKVYDPQGGRLTRRVTEHYAALGHLDRGRVNDLTADIGGVPLPVLGVRP